MSDRIRLDFFGLPAINTLDDFAEITRISKYTIYQLSYNTKHHYKEFLIPKKSGGVRTIHAPSRKLKAFQAWILHNILYKLQTSPNCKGFHKGSSTVDNAKPHRYNNMVLTIDICDFYPSIHRRKVFKVFRAVGYNQLISTVLTNICTYNEKLPQGSPSSPHLSNLIAFSLDKRIQGFVGKRGITYTRYADDLTFSGLVPSKVISIIPTIRLILADEGFTINKGKTRVAGSGKAKRVTGLTISNEEFGVGKKLWHALRCKIFHLTKDSEQSNISLLKSVNGWLAYLNSVDKKRLREAKAYVERLKARYPSTLIMKVKNF